MRIYCNENNNHFRLALVTVISVLLFLAILSTFLIKNINYDHDIFPDLLPALTDTTTSEPSISSNWLPVTLEDQDNFNTIAGYFGISDSDLQKILEIPIIRSTLTHLKSGTTLNLLFNDEHELIGLKYPLDDQEVLLTRSDQQWKAKISQSVFLVNAMSGMFWQWQNIFEKGIKLGRNHASMVVKSENYFPKPVVSPEAPSVAAKDLSSPKPTTIPAIKFFVISAKQAKDHHLLYHQLQKIFQGAVNFEHELHATDQFSVLHDGQGHILLATLNFQHQTLQAVRYTNSSGHTGYYTPDGQSLRKSLFIAAPLKFTRISDKFTMQRMHPVLHVRKPHFGVDYAAPSGTPVRAVGNGIVSFHGWHGGYGRTIVISHSNKYQTLYAHLSHINHKLKTGQPIIQGQIIGYVGSTGLTTGPHLHFGLYQNGKAINPELVLPKKNLQMAVAKRDRADFLSKTNRLLTQLASLHDHMHLHG